MSVHGRSAPAARSLNWVWDVPTLAWVMQTQAGGGGGGDASAANQLLGNASLSSIDAKLTNPLPVSAATLPLPTGAATGAKQDTGNASLSSIDGKTPALGQQLAAASSPVVLTAIQVAALTPPAAITGYALEAGHLAAIDTATAKIPAQGQALAAASTPVVLTALQVTALTPPAAITGFALESTQLAEATLIGAVTEAAPASDTASSGLNGRLQRIAQRLTSLIALFPAALGQGTMAQSLKVVVASDQTAIPTTFTKTDLTPSSPTTTSVGVASAQAVAAAATRKGLILVNVSNARISLGFGAAAVLDSGVTLYPGGSYSMGDYDFDLGAVNAIASAALSNLAIQEYLT